VAALINLQSGAKRGTEVNDSCELVALN